LNIKKVCAGLALVPPQYKKENNRRIIMKQKMCIAALALFVVVPLSSFGVLADFNTAGDLTGNFNNNDGISTHQDPDLGLSNSGSVDFSNSGQLWVYNQQSFDLSQGDLTISMYLKLKGSGTGSTDNFWLGFTADATDDYTTAAGGSSSSDEFYLYLQEGAVTGADQYKLGIKDNNKRPALTANAQTTDNNWYYLTMTASKVDDGTISTTSAMYNSATDGAVGSLLLSTNATFASASASDSTLYAFFGGATMQNNGSSVGDNFSVTQIPEPATLTLISTVGAGLLFIRRKFCI
jgi:hypothetical protein